MTWAEALDSVSSRPWRLLFDSEADGLTNMRRDEELLESACEPVLRLYSWERPTLSLGYSQRWTPPAEFPWVRRPTGGRALLHADEITYCLVLPGMAQLLVDEAFCGITGTLRVALRELGFSSLAGSERHFQRGSPSCLASVNRGELVTSQGKLVGSAQARRGGSLLQHGSLVLQADQAMWERAFGEHPRVQDLPGLTPQALAAAWGRALKIVWT